MIDRGVFEEEGNATTTKLHAAVLQIINKCYKNLVSSIFKSDFQDKPSKICKRSYLHIFLELIFSVNYNFISSSK